MAKAIIDGLFTRIQSRYGNLWSSRFGRGDNAEQLLKAAKIEWAEGLHAYPEDVINQAFETYCRTDPRNPPTLDLYINACRGIYLSKVNGLPAEKVVRSSSALGNSHLLELRQSLGMPINKNNNGEA